MWAKSLWSFRIITLIGKIIYLKGWVRNMSSGFFRCVFFFFFYFCAPQSPEAGSQTLFSRATAQEASVTADLRVARLLLLSLCSSGDFQNTLLCCLWAFPLPHSVSVHSLGPQPQLSLLMSFFLRVEALFCLVFHTLICSPDFRDWLHVHLINGPGHLVSLKYLLLCCPTWSSSTPFTMSLRSLPQ